MARPTVSATTERLYASLPEMYRDSDEPLDFPLLRYLSLLGDQAGEVDTLYERIDYVTRDDGGTVGDTSDLADPATADVGWLRWLGALVGAQITPDLTDAEARDAVRFAPAGYQAGTTAAVAAAARTALIGQKYVKVHDHSVTEPGNGGQWDVLLVTRVSDTPDVNAVLAAVVKKKAKPAGVVLRHRAYSATFAQVQAATEPSTFAGRQAMFPTFQDASDYLPPGA